MSEAVMSPQTRPAPSLRLVTQGDAEACTAAPTLTPAKRGTAQPGWLRLQAAITDRDRWVARVRAASAYYTPPSVFTDRPASLTELAEYATTAPWTTATTGPVRTAGIWWHRLVGYPKTVTNRYSEWIWQRPGRAIPALLLVKLTASTTYGAWVVDHLIYPVFTTAGRVLL